LLHTFCPQNCADGEVPSGGLTLDASGKLIGTAIYGGGNYQDGGGVIFRIDRNGTSFEQLYAFCAKPGCTDGAYPVGLPVMDASGTLYGTTQWGGNNGGGKVYSFVP
jgi:hypothetical protein